MHLTPAEVENLVAYQVGALAGIAAAEGVRLSHVKPHGALYNMAARDAAMAGAIARARPGRWTRRWCCSGCRARELIAAGERAGLRVASEVFADRGYRADGSLAPRGTTGAVMTDPARGRAGARWTWRRDRP